MQSQRCLLRETSRIRDLQMKTVFAMCLFVCFAAPAAHAVALQPLAPFTPLYSAHNAMVNDNFYTIDPSQLATAINIHGYVDTGIVGYVEKAAQPNTLPFRRFYKGLPQTDHFYTTSAAEEALVTDSGWVFERNEGYLYSTQVPGSIALYRVNRFTPETGDQVHKYTTNYSEVNSLVAAGWKLDTVAGYLYPQAFPTVEAGAVLGLRCPAPGLCGGANRVSNFRDYYFPILNPASTIKPAGTTRQRMTFQLGADRPMSRCLEQAG
jgi:hypothetical protein